MGEVWKPCPGYEGYEVSDLGRVRSVDRHLLCAGRQRFHRGRVLSGQADARGYVTVILGRNSRRELVHRLVAKAFVVPVAGCDEVNHMDLVKGHNAATNLEWVDRAGNLRHAHQLGRKPTGAKPTVITQALVVNVRARRKTGATERAIAQALQVSPSTVHKICVQGAGVRTVEAVSGRR